MKEEVVRSREQPRVALTITLVDGGVAGGITVVLFALVHDLWISDIWFNIGPMVFSGALCGLAIVWNYRAAVLNHSFRTWFGFNAVLVGLLVTLGALSFVLLEPRFTMAEAMSMGGSALAELIPPALPLMIGATLVGTIVVWAGYRRNAGALLPSFVVQALLVFLVGHNLAILALVELSGALLGTFVEFIGMTALLGFGFAGGVVASSQLRGRTSGS